MSRYGQISESDETAEQFRVGSFISSMGHIDFGNCGVPSQLQDFFKNRKELVEDVFVDDDSLYILPVSKEAAKELYNIIVYYDREWDEQHAIADEVNWLKLGGRYWLSLWWD